MNDNSLKSRENLIRELDEARSKILQLEATLSETSPQTDHPQSKIEDIFKEFDVQLESIFDASPVPYALNDDDQNILYINPAFTKTFGYKLDDIPTLEDWWPKAYPDREYREWVNNTWGRHLNNAIETGQPFEPMELNIICKNGKESRIIATAASLTEAYKNIHLVILFDITDRHLTRLELEKTASLLDNVINSTPDLIFVKNTKLQTILCNKAYSSAVGKNRISMYGNTDIENGWDPELVLGNKEKGIRGFMEDDKAALSGVSIHNPNDPANVDGEIRTFDTRKLPLKDSSGQITGIIGVARDITERQQAVNDLKEANEEFTATLKAIPDLLFELDEQGRYINIWASDEELLASQKSLLLGNLVKDMLPEDAAEEVYSALHDAAIHGVSQGQVIRLELPDGEHWFELSTAFKSSRNELKHFIMLSREITARINTERQLRRSQKMDALGKLTGGIAHDFNNMLGVILGYSELMEETLQDEEHIRFTKSIIQAANRARILTTKLLTFARKQSSDSQSTSINAILKRDQLMLEKTLTAKVKLTLSLQDSLWSIFVDPELLADAILNMAINSMHAMPSGGELKLETHNLHIQPSLANNLSIAPGDYVQLAISDNGCGMNNEIKEHLFEPFFTTKGESGTGLGLSQVYGFVQQSKSEIFVESAKDSGTTISIYFPRHIINENNIENTIIESSDNPLKGNETILVVDDEPSLRNLAADILSARGYNILSADGAAEALNILKQETTDLLLTDIIMPEMDGFQLISEVKNLYPEIKILIASGYNDDLYLSIDDQELIKNQLSKPYKPDELLQKIHALLEPKIQT